MKTQTTDTISLLFDPEGKKVGCVLLQAALGYGDANWVVNRYFDSNAWEMDHPEKLKPIRGTLEEWKAAARICNRHHEKGRQ